MQTIKVNVKIVYEDTIKIDAEELIDMGIEEFLRDNILDIVDISNEYMEFEVME